MERTELLEVLLDLAQQAGITVRREPGAAAREGELRPRSGACKVRGRLWLVVVGSEPLEDRIEVVAATLREHAPGVLERRYLPPAVRERLDSLREGDEKTPPDLG